MQSYLGPYKDAATDREEKLRRAIRSVLSQSFHDWELMVIADGCEATFNILDEFEDSRIDCRLIRKQTMWSGAPRNYGLSQIKGELVVYLDADDYLGPYHLEKVLKGIGENDWAFFNDLVKTPESFIERDCLIKIKGQHGTSNIVHKRELGARWTAQGYASDDWGLVQHLLKLSNKYSKIPTPEYFVCHIPKRVDL